MNKCFIIGTPRSGTTQLCQYVASHPEIKNKYISDYILQYATSTDCFNKNQIKSKADNLLNKHNVIKEIIFGPTVSNFNLFDIQKYYRNYIYSKNLVILRTKRKNKLQQSLSSELAIRTNYWHKSDKNYKELLKKISPIPISELRHRIKILNKLDKILDLELENIKKIEINYEKFYYSENEHENILYEIFINMDVACSKKIIINNNKLNNNEHYKMIPNINEIEKELSNLENGFLFD